MQIQNKNESLKDPPMFGNTGGGGKGIRPNQHNQQQQQQQAQQHHHHQSHHQTHHQQHQQQQAQLQPGSLHQTSSQSSGNSHSHPHQQQAAAPPPHQPQYQPHLAFYTYPLSQLHQNTTGQNANANIAGSQLAPSPPTHTGGNGSQGASMAGSGGGAGGGNAASNAVSGGRPGSSTNTIPHYSTGNAMMQGTLPPPSNNHFIPTPYHMQLQQQNAVMVTQYSSAAVAAAAAGQHGNPVGGQTGAALYQAQQQAQTTATQQQGPFYNFGTVAPQAPTGLHHPSQHHQMRNMITTVPQPYFYTLQQSIPPQRSNLLANPHQQQPAGSGGSTVHVTAQLQNPGSRGAGGGPTTYVPQSYCTPPIQMGASTAMASQTQPLLAPGNIGPAQLQGAYGHLAGSTAASSSSTSLNLSSASGAGGPASSSAGTEKPRRHAIPIIDPVTLQAVTIEQQNKSTVAVEMKSPAEVENKPTKTTTVTLTAPPERESAAKLVDKSSPALESAAAETTSQTADAATKDKIDQQMQTDVITDKSLTPPPLPDAHAAHVDNTMQHQAVKSAPTTGLEENDDTDADTPELEHDDDAYVRSNEAVDSSYAPTTASVTDNPLSRDGGDQPPVMDSDDTDQTTETDVNPMSQMDDDTNCKRLQSEDEQQQPLNADPIIVAANTINEDKQTKNTPQHTNSVEKSKEPSRESNEAIETDDSITIQRKTVTGEDHTKDKELNVAPAKAKEMSKAAKVSNISPPALANNANNNNKKQPSAIESNAQTQSTSPNSEVKLDTSPRGAAVHTQQQANDDAFITVSRKKNKVAAKRNAKENQKKPQQQSQATQQQQQQHRMHTERSNSTTSNTSNKSHNNNNNNNNRNVSEQPTNAQQHHISDVHNANSAISSSNNNVSGNKQHQSPQPQKTPSPTNNNNENVDAATKGGLDTKDSENNDKHAKTPEISEHFLQPSATSTAASAASKLEDPQVQFLNSSSSAAEDDEERLKEQHQQTQPEKEADSSSLQNVRFDNFKENEQITDAENKTSDQSKTGTCSESVDFSDAQAAHGRPALASIPSKPNKALHVVTPTIQKHPKGKQNLRYSLDDLKSLAKAPESRKAPMVPCRKDDVISQLFVPRQNLHNNTQAVGGMHLPQPYQHMNFHENMEFIGGKRRPVQQRKHDHQSITSSCGNIAVVGGPGGNAGGTTVGMTGGSVSVTGTSFARPVKMIRVNLSLNEEIKLAESENAWQPATLISKSQASSGAGASDSVETVVKKVRGVLNKLTPDNFGVLLKTMTSITVDSDEKMQNVMILIFEKTVNEPNFAPTYAKFCKILFQEIKPDSRQQFNNLLIKRIQTEFEQNVNKADAKKSTLQPLVDKLKTCTDPMERQAIEAEIEHQEYQFRRRAWGTVRFIGELYKLSSLSSERVMTCIESLLKHGSEEKLEYMCKLLTTVGHLLEDTPSSKQRLSDVFRKISQIVNNSRGTGKNANQSKISSRVRFMMQDVMDLRARHWDQTPTHPSQISAAASISSSGGGGNSGNSNNNNNAQHQQRRRHQDEKNNRNNYDRGGSSQRMGYGGSNSQKQNRLMDRDGGGGGNYYSKNSQKSSYQQDGIDVKKLTFSTCDDSSQATVELGNKNNFVWRRTGKATGASGGSMQNPSTVPFRGMSGFSASQQYRTSDSNSSSAYSSMTRTTNPFQMLSTREPESHQSDTERPSASQTSASSSSNEDSDGEEKSISVDAAKDYEKQINGFVEEFLDCAPTNSYGWQSDALQTWRLNKLQQHVELMYYLLTEYLHLAKVNKLQRSAVATIFSYLLRTKAFDKKTFAKAYDQFAKEFPEVLVDVPNGWTYVFEFLGPLLHDRLLNIDDIWRADWKENVYFTKTFVKAFIVHFTKDFGANYVRDLWHKVYKLDRGQRFIADPQKWNDFIESQGLRFLYDDNSKPPVEPTRRNEDHIKRMEVLLKGGTNYDLAIDYINTNVHIDNSFLESLTRFLCCDYATVMTPSSNSSSSGSSSSTKKGGDESKAPQFNKEMFSKCCVPLLHRCIDAQEEYEVICLETAFESIHQFHNFRTAIDLTRYIFGVLYDCEIISKESFEKWSSKHKSDERIQNSPNCNPTINII